ncbi:MAG TPA: MerR family transcriptional regulator [Bacteroidia bacterium]|nr:MerR family transcriptional regulator [Bacteroidia bacterium]
MSSYHISELEKLTGIRAHTLRIWESRYRLIKPHRTSTNIRYYDDDQLKKLLKVATLLSQGMKISKIADLSDRQLASAIQELEKAAPQDVNCEGLINGLTASMLSFDEAAFEKVFSSAVIRLGLYEAVIRVFYPFLKKTGLMWSSDEAMPVQEHFASAIIRRKLIVAIDGLPAPSQKGKTFLLFLPEGEWHETGLLLSDYIVRSRGFKTVYLSQNVPAENVQEVIKLTKPSHLLALYFSRQDRDKIQSEMHQIALRNKNIQVLLGGNESLVQAVKKAKNISILSSPADLFKFL